ncbi:MAG: GTPase ObgE [Verrucomicrobiota bacterium]
MGGRGGFFVCRKAGTGFVKGGEVRHGKGVFVDRVRIFCKAGDGGNGAVSFRREKFVPEGGPDGGDGADGGEVVLEVSNHVDNLKAFFYDPKLLAEDGGAGEKYKKSGKKGRPKVGKVPPGTVVYRTEARTVKEALDMEQGDGIDVEPIADLTKAGERVVLCQPGKGGRGNWHFRSATNQAPEERELGTEGEQGVFFLELRRIADVGLVGFPNAGKSTLVGALSENKPKIGNYPFTTLTPSVGVVEFPGFQRCTIADIPGLIEGAHENRGLGHEFLRHITRCHLLLFVVDVSGFEGRDPIVDLQVLRTEVRMYDEELGKFPWMIVANKMDVEGAEENLVYLRQRFPKVEIVPISAKKEEGLDELRRSLCEKVGAQPLD